MSFIKIHKYAPRVNGTTNVKAKQDLNCCKVMGSLTTPLEVGAERKMRKKKTAEAALNTLTCVNNKSILEST